MKTLLFTFAAVVLLGTTSRAHDSDAYVIPVPDKQVAQPAGRQPADAAITGTGIEVDRSAAKLIDNLTERLYLERKKRWEKERGSLVSN